MRKVLVAYDGSLLSRKAIEEAKRQARLEPCTEVHILSMINETGPSTNTLISRSYQKEIVEDLEPQMESIQKEFQQEDIPVSTEIILGGANETPGEKVCQYAEKNKIDLIIAGSRGLSKVKNILLGSVSTNIVQHAASPVLIMK